MRAYRQTLGAGWVLAILAAATGGAAAGDSLKDSEPAADRKFSLSWNVGITSDYMFRGVSQTAERPALQVGADLSYGILYAGLWASNIDFGFNLDGARIAKAELDLYAGIKPTWGSLNFDFGVIYYAYPGARDNFPSNPAHLFRELDYVEIKAGVSGSPVKNLTTGVTVFYSPEYTSKQGDVWTVELAAAYELPKIWHATPTVGGLLGYQAGDFSLADFAAGRATYVTANGKDDYLYWNVGLTLAIEKLSLDFRYWGTDISNSGPVAATNFCTGATFQCDDRFVVTAKITY
jgi:uncharacterized protein (TIGR02001 family)